MACKTGEVLLKSTGFFKGNLYYIYGKRGYSTGGSN